jgi:molybdate transport system substrate-binding protein
VTSSHIDSAGPSKAYLDRSPELLSLKPREQHRCPLRAYNDSAIRMPAMIQLHRSFGILTCLAFAIGCAKEEPKLQSTEKPLLVSAAASTRELVEALAVEFTEKTGIAVRINAGASNSLATQIIEGAPAELFLSASKEWSDAVVKAGLSASSTPLLTNELVIVVPKDNSANVHTPEDLLNSQVKKIALAGENVPAGRYADQALTSLQLLAPLTSENKIVRGQDVRSALSFVENREAEAGIVYSTDVKAAKDVVVAYEFDPSLHDEIVYVLVLIQRPSGNADAVEFYDYIQSDEADATFERFGFSRIVTQEVK